MKHYTVEYREYQFDEVKRVYVIARNMPDAYTKALDTLYEDGINPYSAWVAGVTYNNGNYKQFNTFEGMPY